MIEYGRPKYLSDRDGNVTEINNINENVNARFLYMSFKRTRFLPLGAPVTDETKSTTTVSLRGIECTLRQLFGNIVFITHAPTSFKRIIYERILSTYRDNIVDKYADGDLDCIYLQIQHRLPENLLCLFTSSESAFNEKFRFYGNKREERGTREKEKDSKKKSSSTSIDHTLQKCCGILVQSLSMVIRNDPGFAKTILTLYADTSPLFLLIGHHKNRA